MSEAKFVIVYWKDLSAESNIERLGQGTCPSVPQVSV